jgi:hypothetical protein
LTIVVGVRCTDGIVIGADSAATSALGQQPMVRLPTDKLAIIGGKVIVAGTGAVGLGQRFQAFVQNAWDTNVFQQKCIDCALNLAANTVGNFKATHVPYNQHAGWGYGALLAGAFADGPGLAEFGLLDFQPELKTGKLHFVTMGSGQLLADPFVAFVSRVLWGKEMPDVRNAMFGVYWALQHTIDCAPGGVGGPIKIATLQQIDGDWLARIVEEEALQEQAQHIAEIEKRISAYPAEILAEAAVELPPAPPVPDPNNGP